MRRGAIPNHIGVLPDGNRRFARTTGMGSAGAGHRDGADNIERLIDWCDELGIPVITVWALSTDNLNRPADELEVIFSIIETRVEALAKRLQRATVSRRIRSVGRRDLLPASTAKSIQRVEEMTAGNADGDLIIAIGYGGRDEIVDAVKRMIDDYAGRGESLNDLAHDLTAKDIGKYLYAPDIPDPDLGNTHVRRAAAVWIHALAERVQRVLLLRSVLASISTDRLSAGDPFLRPAASTPRALTAMDREPIGAIAHSTFRFGAVGCWH